MDAVEVVALYFDANEACILVIDVEDFDSCGVTTGLPFEDLVPAAAGSSSCIDPELGDSIVAVEPRNTDIIDSSDSAEVDVDISIFTGAGPAGIEVAVDRVLGWET